MRRVSAKGTKRLPLTQEETWRDYYLRLRTALMVNAVVVLFAYGLTLFEHALGFYVRDFSPGHLLFAGILGVVVLFWGLNEHHFRTRRFSPTGHLYLVGTGIYASNLVSTTTMVHLTGGAQSVYPLLYVLLAGVGSFIAPRKIVVPLAVLGMACHGGLLLLENAEILQTYPHGMFTIHSLMQQGTATLAVFGAYSLMTLGSLFFGRRLYRLYEAQRDELVKARADLKRLVDEQTRDLTKTLENNRALRERERKLKEENEALRSRLLWPEPTEPIIGDSPTIQRVFRSVEKVAPTSETVLITGETGVGKELVARLIHLNSDRRDRRMLIVDSPAIPDTLFESELFGHVKGAFSGASTDRQGILAEGDGSTVFLDEIGELPPGTQAKLLRFLENKKVRPIGSNRARKADVRIIAATNRNLETMVGRGEFREDLLHRFGVFRIHVPALRERRDDIRALAQCFLKQFNEKHSRNVRGFAAETLRKLERLSYPGNIRQLKNIVVSMAILVPDGEDLGPEHLLETLAVNEPHPGADGGKEAADLKSLVEDFERRTVREHLDRYGQDRTKTAKAFGITRQALWKKMTRLGMLK